MTSSDFSGFSPRAETLSSAVQYFALIPAAGIGARMGANLPKQYLDLAGRCVLQRSVDPFLAAPEIAHVFVVISPEDTLAASKISQDPRITLLPVGGATRSETVQNALQWMSEQRRCRDQDWVLVHDAARPGLTVQLVQKLIAEIASDAVGGLLALPVVDTLKRQVDVHSGKLETVSRDAMWQAQTPQMFRKGLLQHALQACPEVTDEASAVEALDLPIRLVEGALRNRKLTLPDDLEFLSMYFERVLPTSNSSESL